MCKSVGKLKICGSICAYESGCVLCMSSPMRELRGVIFISCIYNICVCLCKVVYCMHMRLSCGCVSVRMYTCENSCVQHLMITGSSGVFTCMCVCV